MTFLFLGDPELTEELLVGEIRRLREALEKVAVLESHDDYALGDAIEIARDTLSYDATKPSYLNVNAKPDV